MVSSMKAIGFDAGRNVKTALVAVMLAIFFILILSAGSVYAAIDEAEPNDTWQNANSISLGTTVYGKTSTEKEDEDYYKFKAPVSGTVNITIYADKMDENEYAHAWVYDSSDKELTAAHDSLSTIAGASAEFPVVSGGTYYILVNTHNYLYDFYGEYHFELSYSVGPTTIKKVTPGKGSITVKWDKKRAASFYQIQLVKKGVYDDYDWNKARTIKVSQKLKKKTIKKLGRKEKYYVRVRVVRVIDGKIYYSKWSSKKSVKTK